MVFAVCALPTMRSRLVENSTQIDVILGNLATSIFVNWLGANSDSFRVRLQLWWWRKGVVLWRCFPSHKGSIDVWNADRASFMLLPKSVVPRAHKNFIASVFCSSRVFILFIPFFACTKTVWNFACGMQPFKNFVFVFFLLSKKKKKTIGKITSTLDGMKGIAGKYRHKKVPCSRLRFLSNMVQHTATTTTFFCFCWSRENEKLLSVVKVLIRSTLISVNLLQTLAGERTWNWKNASGIGC